MYPTYKTCVEPFGAVAVGYEEVGSYQGDFYMVLKKDGLYAWVSGCYGSCSGCDLIEGSDEAEIADYGRGLVENADWLTKANLLLWLRARDWPAQPGHAVDPEYLAAVKKLIVTLEDEA